MQQQSLLLILFLATSVLSLGDAFAFIKRNLHHVQHGRGFNTLGELEIPETALEELLVNALIHRDYFTSASIRLMVFADRVEIVSPGHLPDSLSPDARAANAVAPVADPDSAMGRPEAPGQGAALAFDRTDPAVRLHLAAAVAGTPLLAMPQTATPAEAYMALGVLFVVAAFAMLLLGWRGPRPPRPGGNGVAPPKPGGDD